MSTTTTATSSPNRWLLVSSPENFEVSRSRGFDIAGMKSRHRKKAEAVQQGDTVFFYLTGMKAIAGLAEVTGTFYEDHSHIWDSKKANEEYPFRFSIHPISIIPNPGDFVAVEVFIDELEYVQRWSRENWTLAFQGNVHRLSESDYALLAEAVRAAVDDVGGIGK